MNQANLTGCKPILVGNTNDERGQGPSNPANAAIGCPSAAAAKARRDAGVPAWRYQYSATWPNQKLGGTAPPDVGAWHGSEIALIFGTTEVKNNLKGTDLPAEKELAKKMRDAWAGFAKDPEHGLEKLGWPLYDPNSKQPFRLVDVELSR
jgi:cholinesterase